MIDIYNASLADILPDSLKADSQFVAIAEALDPLLKNFAADARKAMHLPRLDELSGSILDVLAQQFHVDFYNALTLTDTQKRNLIRQSIALHRLKGSVHAVEFVTKQFFRSPQVIELGGFLFKIVAKEFTAAPDAFETFCRMLFDVKPVRSWLVGIDSDISPPKSTVHVGGALATTASVRVDIARPKDSINRFHVGGILLHSGHVTTDIYKPKPSKVCVHVGSPFVLSGHVLIDSKDRPIRQTLSPADLATADITIARGDNFVDPPLYDWIRIFFKSPTANFARRFITIKHPRPNLTQAEIKAVADYATEHRLLLSRAGREIEEAPHAHLIARRITNII